MSFTLQAFGKDVGKFLSHAEHMALTVVDGFSGEGEVFNWKSMGNGHIVISCLLKDRNQLYYLSHADNISWLHNGIEGEGEEWLCHYHGNDKVSLEPAGKRGYRLSRFDNGDEIYLRLDFCSSVEESQLWVINGDNLPQGYESEMYLSLSRINETELEEIRQAPEKLKAFLNSNTSLTLDESWHAIHFMLTGQVWEFDTELGRVILGGYLIGEDNNGNFDIGMGPATYVAADEVKVLAEKLAALDIEKQKANFSLSMFNGNDIYGFSDGDRAKYIYKKEDYIFEHLKSLIEYFQDAAARGQIIIKMTTFTKRL